MAIELNGMAPLLQVFDMPVSLHFYRDLLGFQVVQASGDGDDVDWVLLRSNDVDLMLNTAYERGRRPASRELGRQDGHGDTTLYFGCYDVESAYQHLLANGVYLEKPVVTGYGWKALGFVDPDGYQLCFHHPMEQTMEQ